MYLIRQLKNNEFQIAKFEDRRYPVDVYTISKNRCNCPAIRNACKHKTILAEWQKNGSIVGQIVDVGEIKGQLSV